jgi:hypothetical protein
MRQAMSGEGSDRLTAIHHASQTMDREQFLCGDIVQALRQGLVPTRGLERIAVGRESEMRQLRRDLAFSKNGGAWVRCISGDYGAGKTFLCSWLREEAWKEGFVVAAVDLGRDAPLHRFEVIYHRIMEGLRTEHFREVPAFEFILQEWLFDLEKDVRRSMGLNPLHPEQRTQIATVVEGQIDEHLTKLRIYDASFANAVRGYYAAAQSGNDIVTTAAASWLKGDPTVPTELCQGLEIRGIVDRENAVNFLRAMAALMVHIGYAGLVMIFDEAELIRGIARADSRNAAYENIRLLMDRTTQGDFAHCGFVFAGSEDLFNDELRGVPSCPALNERLTPLRGKSKTPELRQPLLQLKGLPDAALFEVALKVRDAHGRAYGWQPDLHLTDDLLSRLIKEAAARFGEMFKSMPRGFLKIWIDVLDDLRRGPQVSASELLGMADYIARIEEVERQEAHLLDSP